MMGRDEAVSAPPTGTRPGFRDLPDSWGYILTHPNLRGLFFNKLMVASLLLCTEPLLSVLMLDKLHFQTWQYGLAFASPCVGGLIGSRLSRRLVSRFGASRVMQTFGSVAVGWPIGLAFIPGGAAGLLMVFGLQFAMITCLGVFNPIAATYRLEQTAPDRVARTLSAWSVSSSAATAVLTALWGLLAELIGLREAIALAGILALPSPLLLPRVERSRVPAKTAVSGI